MNLSIPEAQLMALLLCSTRLAAWMLIAPPIATAGVPRQVRVMLAVAIALPVVPTAQAHAPAPELAPIINGLVLQIVIGAGLGFVTRLIFSAIEGAGSLLDFAGGFSAAYAYDPFTQSSNAVLGRFYGMLASVLLFASNAHLVIFQGILRTFTAIPIDTGIRLSTLSSTLTHGLSSMFIATLQVAAPLMAVLFLADVALGIISRISPQLNVFQLSFPFKIILTLGLIGLSFALLPRVITQLANDSARLMTGFGSG